MADLDRLLRQSTMCIFGVRRTGGETAGQGESESAAGMLQVLQCSCAQRRPALQHVAQRSYNIARTATANTAGEVKRVACAAAVVSRPLADQAPAALSRVGMPLLPEETSLICRSANIPSCRRAMGSEGRPAHKNWGRHIWMAAATSGAPAPPSTRHMHCEMTCMLLRNMLYSMMRGRGRCRRFGPHQRVPQGLHRHSILHATSLMHELPCICKHCAEHMTLKLSMSAGTLSACPLRDATAGVCPMRGVFCSGRDAAFRSIAKAVCNVVGWNRGSRSRFGQIGLAAPQRC